MLLSFGQVDCRNHLSECTIHLSEIYKANATNVKIRYTQSSVGQVLQVFHLSDCHFLLVSDNRTNEILNPAWKLQMPWHPLVPGHLQPPCCLKPLLVENNVERLLITSSHIIEVDCILSTLYFYSVVFYIRCWILCMQTYPRLILCLKMGHHTLLTETSYLYLWNSNQLYIIKTHQLLSYQTGFIRISTNEINSCNKLLSKFWIDVTCFDPKLCSVVSCVKGWRLDCSTVQAWWPCICKCLSLGMCRGTGKESWGRSALRVCVAKY